MVAEQRLLDVRSFQDIVDEARRLIPLYCPEWTDHNVSDPGMTLVELFAWMTEVILYRLNRVPDEMYERFLQLVNVIPEPPVPARADVTFYWAGRLGPGEGLVIPEGSEVGTVQTESEDAVVFSTVLALAVSGARLAHLRRGNEGVDLLDQVLNGQGQVELMSTPPLPNEAIYFGFEGDVAGYSIDIYFDCVQLAAVHFDSRYPPLAWEYWSGARESWEPLLLLDDARTGEERDRTAPDPTQGLNAPGLVSFHIPSDSSVRLEAGTEATWVRVRYVPVPGQNEYDQSPRLNSLTYWTIGATAPVRQSATLRDEVVGRSDGTPDQTFPLLAGSVLREAAPHGLEVLDEDGVAAEWTEVEHFGESSELAHHFCIDYARGEIRFGPAIRSRDGTVHQYGGVPPRNTVVRIRAYSGGGGARGNVGARAIVQKRSSLPGIQTVINYRGATGGKDRESLDETRFRAHRTLRHSGAAITKEDYEAIALQVPGVGRAFCSTATAGQRRPGGLVRLVIVPDGSLGAGQSPGDALVAQAALLAEVQALIDERRPLGTEVRCESVPVTWIDIEATIGVRPGAPVAEARRHAVERLRDFFNPMRGGLAAQGQEFGSTTSAFDVAGILHDVREIVRVHDVRLKFKDGVPRTSVSAQNDGLLVLDDCTILVAGTDA